MDRYLFVVGDDTGRFFYLLLCRLQLSPKHFLQLHKKDFSFLQQPAIILDTAVWIKKFLKKTYHHGSFFLFASFLIFSCLQSMLDLKKVFG